MPMKWIDSIEEVLKEYGGSMHPDVIAEEIIRKGQQSRRASPPLSRVSNALRNEDNRDKFMDLGNSKYMLLDTPIRSSILNPYARHLSEFVKFPNDISTSEKEILEKELLDKDQILNLIVNFRLRLVKDEVCFADLLDKLEVEFSNVEEKRYQYVDAALLRRKLENLKADLEKKAKDKKSKKNQNEENGPKKQDVDAILRSLDEALKKASNGKVKVSVRLLGAFVIGKPNPKVVIYYKNIQRACGDDWTDVLSGVFVHEMFHAWNYFNAGGKRSVLAIDEPMVEFETLYFLKQLETFTHSKSHPLHDKVESVSRDRLYLVQEKKQEIGDVAAYGFGYYLFNNLRDVESRHWIEAYSKKSDSINIIDKSVYKAKNALTPVYPFMSEEEVMRWMREFIFDGYAIPTNARKYALRKMVLACIETIGRKCFAVQELYVFAPIFKIYMPHCPNLEEELKQQLDELVKDGVLEALPHDCYSMKY